MKILQAYAATILLATGAAPFGAQACVCVKLSMSEAFRQAEHVFLAELREIDVRKGTTVAIDTVRATFTALESFKGQPDVLPAISSTTSDGVCGIGKLLLSGKRMIVFTQGSGHVGACDGTRPYDSATNAADIAALRAMRQAAQRKHAP